MGQLALGILKIQVQQLYTHLAALKERIWFQNYVLILSNGFEILLSYHFLDVAQSFIPSELKYWNIGVCDQQRH
jgi:hypothetical protein